MSMIVLSGHNSLALQYSLQHQPSKLVLTDPPDSIIESITDHAKYYDGGNFPSIFRHVAAF
jgi:hypothetical protein